MLISQGLLHDGYVYGVNTQHILPTLIHPNEELDGAVISGNCVAACDKITTYQHQNNSVILDLYEQDGKTINFLGVILTPELTTLEGKFRTCDYTAKLCKMLGADGVIISEEGYGNPDSDLLMICKRLEDAGIKTVLITDECSGWDGMSQPLADTAKEAVAVVSTGNVSHVVTLPPAEKVIGDDKADMEPIFKEEIVGPAMGFNSSLLGRWCNDGLTSRRNGNLWTWQNSRCNRKDRACNSNTYNNAWYSCYNYESIRPCNCK